MEQMTAEDAIRWIEWKYATDENTQTSRALKTAIDALEKQVPKKPIPNKRGYYDCPNCNCNLEIVLDEVSDTDFCFICGQALNWTE